MPIYEYDCAACGPFEVSQRITEPALTQHSCGAQATRRISVTAFSLKGGGWYADGYASKKSSGSSAGSCSPSGCEKPGCGAKSADA